MWQCVGSSSSIDMGAIVPFRGAHASFLFAAFVLGTIFPGSTGGDKLLSWAQIISPVDRGVYSEGSMIRIECRFARDPPTGGFFVVKINGRDAGKFSERHLFVETDQFVAGMFHTLACVVQDADGVSLASDNSTFIVRSGCGHRRGW